MRSKTNKEKQATILIFACIILIISLFLLFGNGQKLYETYINPHEETAALINDIENHRKYDTIKYSYWVGGREYFGDYDVLFFTNKDIGNSIKVRYNIEHPEFSSVVGIRPWIFAFLSLFMVRATLSILYKAWIERKNKDQKISPIA